MATIFRFDDFNDTLSKADRNAIEGCIHDTISKSQKILPGPQGVYFDIVVRKGENTRRSPVEGMFYNMGITVILDTKYPVYKNPNELHHLASTVAHEWHHIVRSLYRPAWETIGQRLISEGLALAFEEQVIGALPYLAVAVSKQKLELQAPSIKNKLNRRSSEHHLDIFLGNPTKGYPRWLGYSLGYSIVRPWLEQNKKTAAEAVGLDANKLIRPWQMSLNP